MSVRLAPIVIAAGFSTAAGCAPHTVTIADAFPPGGLAAPWVLGGDVWTGSMEQAAPGLGEDADVWATFAPQRVWLAVYRHQTDPRNKLTARLFAFASPDAARRAFDYFRPPLADDLDAGDAACWTDDGILVCWSRLVFEIFGSAPAAFAAPEQSLYLFALLEKRMPSDRPHDPQ